MLYAYAILLTLGMVENGWNGSNWEKYQGEDFWCERVYHRHQSGAEVRVVAMLEARSFRVSFGVTLLMCAMACGATFSAQLKNRTVAPTVDAYRISVGDVLQVTVFQHPELSRKVIVGNDGNIVLPTIDDVKAAGLTALGLGNLLRDRFEPFLAKPQVRVTVVVHTHPAMQPVPEPTPRDIPSTQSQKPDRV